MLVFNFPDEEACIRIDTVLYHHLATSSPPLLQIFRFVIPIPLALLIDPTIP